MTSRSPSASRWRKKWKPWLDRIEARFGVDRYILLAIWSMESNYGEILKRDDIMRNVVRSLATLAYADPKRAKFARTQLIAALKILQTGDIDESHLSGSWAGAMGQTQFIPTSYQHYAVDMDGNGKRDIWNSIPDALATAANLLKKNGWQAGKTWGYEVTLPAGKLPGGSKTLAQWQALGVVRANGKPFKNGADKATLKVPDGRGGPAFLMIRNFSVIKAYNNADKYALAVGLLADEIAGSSGLVQDWKRPFTKLILRGKAGAAEAAFAARPLRRQVRRQDRRRLEDRHHGLPGEGRLDPGRLSEHGSAQMAQTEIEPPAAPRGLSDAQRTL